MIEQILISNDEQNYFDFEMINIYLILFYLVLICAQNSYAKKIKKYEYINLLSDKDYKEKLNNLRKVYNTKDSNVGLKNKYIYSFYGTSG